jgi:hypothetical protein
MYSLFLWFLEDNKTRASGPAFGLLVCSPTEPGCYEGTEQKLSGGLIVRTGPAFSEN